uniref:Uncharacterized protein n=1 Tax=Cacopsylla melanoneura TaxID=428564 RepID=A0A8D8QYL4_9HEMI
MVSIRLLLLVIFVYAVRSQKAEDDADCGTCNSQHNGRCDTGSFPTRCVSSTGCTLFEWRQNKWTPYSYANKVNCNLCYAIHKKAKCRTKNKPITCTYEVRTFYFNCLPNADCTLDLKHDRKSCN